MGDPASARRNSARDRGRLSPAYGRSVPSPSWATETTTTTPSETSMKAQPASRVFFTPTSSGKSNQAASMVRNNAPSAPAIADTTTESSNTPTPADSSTSRSRARRPYPGTRDGRSRSFSRLPIRSPKRAGDRFIPTGPGVRSPSLAGATGLRRGRAGLPVHARLALLQLAPDRIPGVQPLAARPLPHLVPEVQIPLHARPPLRPFTLLSIIFVDNMRILSRARWLRQGRAAAFRFEALSS